MPQPSKFPTPGPESRYFVAPPSNKALRRNNARWLALSLLLVLEGVFFWFGKGVPRAVISVSMIVVAGGAVYFSWQLIRQR